MKIIQNSYLQIRRTDGTWHPAEVIHRRLISESSNICDNSQVSGDSVETLDIKVESKNDVTNTDKKESENDPYEYYIHYENFNRRLDEWVKRERMRPLDEDVGEVSQIIYSLLNNSS